MWWKGGEAHRRGRSRHPPRPAGRGRPDASTRPTGLWPQDARVVAEDHRPEEAVAPPLAVQLWRSVTIRPMKFGIAIFPTHYAIPMTELAPAVEQLGFESLWVAEHSHIPASRLSAWPGGQELPKHYWHTLDPFVALTEAALASKTLLVATGICLVVQRDPIHTAKQVASLDFISKGRFLFGVGAGWNREEMEDHGTDFSTRFQLMRERVEAMKAIWAQDAAED